MELGLEYALIIVTLDIRAMTKEDTVGGASECWGTFDGNDPGPSGDGFDINGMVFDFVAKKDQGGPLTGTDIRLVVGPDADDILTGTWEFDARIILRRLGESA